MIIYPAIDLSNGKCIRLYQGDYSRQTIYSSNPAEMIEKFASDGASWLHLIDLDGAMDTKKNQTALIAKLIKNSNLKIQTGGGIRTKDQIYQLLEHGAARVIIGSLAVQNREEIAEWLNYFTPERLMIALDITYNKNNQPMVVVNAWKNVSQYSLTELLEYYQTAGLKHVLCTNIMHDGTLSGPDYDLYENLLTQFPALHLQASGGIQSLADISFLKNKINLSGAIIGRALYENKFTLREALSC